VGCQEKFLFFKNPPEGNHRQTSLKEKPEEDHRWIFEKKIFFGSRPYTSSVGFLADPLLTVLCKHSSEKYSILPLLLFVRGWRPPVRRIAGSTSAYVMFSFFHSSHYLPCSRSLSFCYVFFFSLTDTVSLVLQ
jgi:hypothetical protein